MRNKCHKKWGRADGRFVRYRFREDEQGNPFVPFCIFSGHIGLIADDRYRQRRCEKRGKGKYCPHYRRLRLENQERVIYRQTQSIEITVEEKPATQQPNRT